MFDMIRQAVKLWERPDAIESGPGCKPTYRNHLCRIDPVPGDYGEYLAPDQYPDGSYRSSDVPVGGDWVYWEHYACTLDMKNGTCI
mmetsp:Transcript_45479/g.142857  ORF Transcript_45479/g.142857 Transcript_45479/m.142857 type:complete len:86 (-) Transcript_45479:1586-1843(-)